MKIYKKKDRLFFYKPQMLESLKIRTQDLEQKLRVIIFEDVDWQEYSNIFNISYAATGYFRYDPKTKRSYHPQRRHSGIPCMFYKGIPVVNIKDLKRYRYGK